MVRITGRKWNLKRQYYSWDSEKKFPTYNTEEEREFTLETNDVNEAYLWMLENHPEFAVGCGVVADNGNFLFDANLDYYVYELKTENIQEIVENLKERARANA